MGISHLPDVLVIWFAEQEEPEVQCNDNSSSSFFFSICRGFTSLADLLPFKSFTLKFWGAVAASYYLGSISSVQNYALFPREKWGGSSIRHLNAPFLKLFSWAPLSHAEMSFGSFLLGWVLSSCFTHSHWQSMGSSRAGAAASGESRAPWSQTADSREERNRTKGPEANAKW